MTKSKTIIKDQEIEVMTMSVHKRKLILLPKFMGANQKHNFYSVHFIKESKYMGKHSKYSEYKLSFFSTLNACERAFNGLIAGLIQQMDLK